MTVDSRLLELEGKLSGIDLISIKDDCDDVNNLRVEVAEIRGKIEVMTKLMWGIILALVGLLIQGAFV